MSAPAGVLVVGASAAGLSTVEALRRKGYDGRLTVLDAAAGAPYDRPPLSKQILSGTWDPERAHLRTQEQLDALGAEFLLGDAAVALDVPGRTVHTAHGRALSAEAVVLSTGLRPRRLPGAEDLTGLHVLRTLDEAVALRGALRNSRRVVVVGNGVLGSEIAATAAGLGLTTTLAGLQPAPMQDQFGPRVAGALADLHTRNGVRLVSGVGVGELTRDQGRATGVRLTSGEVLSADVVVAAIGCTPATDWLAGSGLDLTDGVTCDAYCRAAPGVYAAGDVARWYHQGLGTHLRLENRTNATAQAGVVAANILGQDLVYAPVPYFWTDQFDVKIQVYGAPAPDADVTIVEGEDGDRFVARYDRAGRTGAVLGWNMPKQARIHSRLLTGTPGGGRDCAAAATAAAPSA
ncbi:NAD(P)/FAD-dependent oxidoreductase [Streptomyces alanosinicus]|uniref:Pyridine nucleotide-disulfide oxidoreductase n=1 Tax=Streptomyces alanosinicus TaxID=68171 RepID=A0A919D3K8_9ACTN|nr:FAD/NAD(P)-binding oxidoreductase [Streptomyces alanosinicus]GHE04885.1 pyridine nucleotide-disulfide oxidoreductase [Streptomyces alanosinicus]